MELNSKQKAAVEAPVTGVIRVRATAGSGKSTVLLKRSEHLHKESPGRIVCIAFNNTVADEFRDKVQRIPDPWVSAAISVFTSYGLANGLLKANHKLLGMPTLPKPMPPEWKVIKDSIIVAKQNGFQLQESQMKAFLAADSWRQSAMSTNFAEMPSWTMPMEKLMEQQGNEALVLLSMHLRRARRASSTVLFQDMISLALELPNETYEELYYKHLLVDEAQDLSTSQHAFVKRIVQYAESTTIVGDESQCIYAFSAANPERFRSIPEDYNATDYVLDINYRSKEPILELANKILALPIMETDMRLEPNGEQPGDPVALYKNQDDVSFWLQGLIDSGVPLTDVAILYRARSHILPLEIQLSTAGIPYHCTNGSFFDHPVIDDFMSYYRFLYEGNLEDWVSMGRVYKYLSVESIEQAFKTDPEAPWSKFPAKYLKAESQRNIWWRMKEFLERMVPRMKTERPDVICSELIGHVLKKKWLDHCSGDPDVEFEYRSMQVALMNWLDKFKTGDELWSFYNNRPKSKGEGVTIITVHKSKGLEWPHVGVWNVGRKTFPLKDNQPEEYRLLYVAVTRAMGTLSIFASNRDESAGVLGELTPNGAQELAELFGL